MKRKYTIILGILFVSIGFTSGYFFAMSQDVQHNEWNKFQNAMVHQKVNVTPSANTPTVSLQVERDNMSGYNVYIKTTNFTFTPENVGKENKLNEGHAHLYVNGKKIARVYGPYFHIPLLDPGKNDIRVTLNTNKHEEYSISGQSIGDNVMLDVSKTEHNKIPHGHTD